MDCHCEEVRRGNPLQKYRLLHSSQWQDMFYFLYHIIMKNPTARRFVPKTFGRWFTPVSLQGRLCVIILTAIILLSAYENNMLSSVVWPTYKQYASFVVDIFVIIFSSSWYMDRYTDGELKRRRCQRD